MINMSVLPGLQSGPHNNAGISMAMNMVGTEEFREYQRQVATNANAMTLCNSVMSRGYKVSSEDTDNHMLLLDLSIKRLSRAKEERILEEIAKSCKKNTAPLPLLTIREMEKDGMENIVELIDKALCIALEIQEVLGPKLIDWKRKLETNEDLKAKIGKVRKEVEFAKKFPLPGHALH